MSSTSTLSEFNDKSLFLKIKKKLIKENTNYVNSFLVDTTSIDIFFKDLNLGNSLLKIDVEGYEYNVLQGSLNKIKEVKFVLIENQFFNMYKNNHFKNCHDFLINNKFILLKKFIYPLLYFEDRFYIKNE